MLISNLIVSGNMDNNSNNNEQANIPTMISAMTSDKINH